MITMREFNDIDTVFHFRSILRFLCDKILETLSYSSIKILIASGIETKKSRADVSRRRSAK